MSSCSASYRLRWLPMGVFVDGCLYPGQENPTRRERDGPGAMVALKEDVELGKVKRTSPAGEDAVGKCRMAMPGETRRWLGERWVGLKVKPERCGKLTSNL